MGAQNPQSLSETIPVTARQSQAQPSDLDQEFCVIPELSLVTWIQSSV